MVLWDGELRLYDLDAQLLTTRQLPFGQCLAPGENHVAVLVSETGAAGESISLGTVTRFDWDLSECGSFPVGRVVWDSLAMSPDGQRLAAAVVDMDHRVIVMDANTGELVAGNNEKGTGGPSWSPDGRLIIAGHTDQGGGDILLFDAAAADGKVLPMEQLPHPSPPADLDSCPFFSTFGANGTLAVLTNESWGACGLFVYTMADRAPVWSRELDPSPIPEDGDENNSWFAHPAAFADDDTLLLAAGQETIHAYRASDGADLGSLAVSCDTHAGFVVEHARHRFWMRDGDGVHAYPFPTSWS
jgi:WD40 repeat protein